MKPFLQRMMAASTLLRTYTGFSRPSLFQYSRTFSSAFQLRKYIDPPVNTDKQQPFEFIAHAAWYPKQKTRNMPSWKHKDAGEDAFFQTKTSQGLALGVADGVGGWSSVGVDPALFSWTLMDNAANAAKHAFKADEILDNAFSNLEKEGKVTAGSSTACVLHLKSTGEMSTCNLGDSAFLLIRDNKIVYESPSQQHYFNCPYQLTVVPESYPNRQALVTDKPKDGDTKDFYLKDGDLILLGTDGYFDNVYSHETLALINAGTHNMTPEDEQPVIEQLVKALTLAARKLSFDRKRLSPWAKAAQENGNFYRGGKVDDITCILTLVRQK